MILEQNSSNVDYLIPQLRVHYGDVDGTLYSDSIFRTALINGIRTLQQRLDYKYQVFNDNLVISYATGFITLATAKGVATIEDIYANGDVFRDPFTTFITPKPLIEIRDELGIIYMSSYLLRKVQISSDSREFYSWGTEDIRFSNLGTQTLLTDLLAQDLARLSGFYGADIVKPAIVLFERI